MTRRHVWTDPGVVCRRCCALAAAAAGALLLVQAGLLDAARANGAGFFWQLDEILFLLLAALVALLVVDRTRHRRLCHEMAGRITEQQAARDLALRDPLTGLLNRRGLEGSASVAIPMAERLLFLADLDQFKAVNDTQGHAIGDVVLCSFADRLRGLAGPGLAIEAARLGGDEFVLVVTTVQADAADAIGACLAQPVELLGRTGAPLHVEVSIGMTRWASDMPLESALEQADLSMYEAKHRGAAQRPLHSDRVFERGLASLVRPGTDLCVAAIGLDRYQSAKRTLGHGFAARLLRAVRERIEQHRPALLVERLGPDTLGVLFAADDLEQAMDVMKTLDALSTTSYMLDDHVIESPLTIGLAGPAPAALLRETVEQAQFSLDEARRSGKRQVVFDGREQHRIAHNVRLMKELRAAIAADSLELHYQPKLSARTGEIDSFEALVRWPHATRGFVSPGEFVPLAEESGDVEALTWWVLERAARDWRRLAETGCARPIYVNVSAQLVGDLSFAERLLAMLAGQEGRIGIEITETAVLANPERALRHLTMIANAGIAIAIDDYGVGLSSLCYLKRLPATELKIDMMFITDLCDSHRDPMIVRSTIDLAHGLGLKVTAEGVDKPESLALLKIMGCDLIQGYQIAAAMPLAPLIDFMKDHDTKAEHIPECAVQLLAFARRGAVRQQLEQ